MTCRVDLTLEGVIRDPMIAAVLRADGVDPRGFEALLRSTQRRLAPPRTGASDETSAWPVTPFGLATAGFCDRPCA